MDGKEILAPVGGAEQLLAAVRCGADAVYLGGKGFNARRHADNFDGTDLAEAVRYCHAAGARVYVTVNTMVTDRESAPLEAEADAVAESGADAVIIQDPAVFRLFGRRWPHMTRYASTQTAVHNVEGALYLEEMGYDGIVLARELTLEEMAAICSAVHIKTEAFVHGAHCMSVSGACYLSSMLGGRSGNRGLCAQPCRLDWRCGEADYALSLKDMSLIGRIRDMAAAGVDCFKIEGRMKRPEYVAAAVTACVRALRGEEYDEQTLRGVFSRSGFTDGYLTGRRDESMFGHRTREDVTGAEPVLRRLQALYRAETPRVGVNMRLDMTAERARLTVTDGTHTARAEDAPEPAQTRSLDPERAAKNLTKTGGSPYFVRSLDIALAPGYTMSAAALNALRRRALDALGEQRSALAPIKPCPSPASEPEPTRAVPERSAFWARFATGEQLRSVPEKTLAAMERLLLPAAEMDGALLSRFGERLTAQLPTVLFPAEETWLVERLAALKSAGLTSVWTNNIYGIHLGKRLGLTVYGGFGLNAANTESVRQLEQDGLAAVMPSFELPMTALEALGGTVPRGAVVYGHLPLMHFRNCPVRAAVGCRRCGGKGSLTDRKQLLFPVECEGRRSSTLLNSVPLDIAERLPRGMDSFLLYFTRESAAEIVAVCERFARRERTDGAHTGGLYFRKLL